MSQSCHQITVADMAPHVHNFKYGENKVAKISSWMIEWIELSLKSGKIHPHDKLPLKGELACHIGVSLGTMQNVFRLAEDSGYIYSKQRLGSFISDNTTRSMGDKLTSRREIVVEKIKQHIKKGSYQLGDTLISIRSIAKEIGFSPSTVRIAIGTLIMEKILYQFEKRFVIQSLDFEFTEIQAKTLSEKITDNLRELVKNDFFKDGKLPSNKELAKDFGVSIKTVHDAIKILSKEGVLTSKRGTYGTVIVQPDVKQDLYCYEKAELKIKNYITQNCDIGAKLPPIKEFATLLNVSTKTVKKALDNLAEDGFVTTARGRLGGTYVIDIPQNINEAYKWLALNPDYVAGT